MDRKDVERVSADIARIMERAEDLPQARRYVEAWLAGLALGAGVVDRPKEIRGEWVEPTGELPEGWSWEEFRSCYVLRAAEEEIGIVGTHGRYWRLHGGPDYHPTTATDDDLRRALLAAAKRKHLGGE